MNEKFLSKLQSRVKILVLGTALWGWGVRKDEAFKILDYFVANDGVYVDVATNYPINKIEKDSGLAIIYIAEWMKSRRHYDLKIIFKLGAKNNSGSSEFDLSEKRVFEIVDQAEQKFGKALYCISVHWDNRMGHGHELFGVQETVHALNILMERGFCLGLSGIKSPELYRRYLTGGNGELIIQVKENLLMNNVRVQYEEFFPNAYYLAYGINLGGLKSGQFNSSSSKNLRNIEFPPWVVKAFNDFLVSNNFTPAVDSIAQLTLYHAFCNDRLSGVILGPRKEEQLIDSINFWRKLNESNPTLTSKDVQLRILGDRRA